MKKGQMIRVDGFFYAVEEVKNGYVRYRRPENSDAPWKRGSCRLEDLEAVEDEDGRTVTVLRGRG